MKFHIPEAITGLIGISLIILSVWLHQLNLINAGAK